MALHARPLTAPNSAYFRAHSSQYACFAFTWSTTRFCAEHILKVGAMLTKLVLPPTCLEDTSSGQC